MPDGVMNWRIINTKLAGFEKHKTIEFDYSFPNGVYKGNVPYSGTSRVAYLPASDEGTAVFKMMVQAFQRKLSFMVGTSLTTGAQNTVVWSGIHHKTSTHGGPFGYPDNRYLSAVTEEFKIRGVDANSVKDLKINIKKGQIVIKNGVIQ